MPCYYLYPDLNPMNPILKILTLCLFSFVISCDTQKQERKVLSALKTLPKKWVNLLESEIEKNISTVHCDKNGMEIRFELVISENGSLPQAHIILRDTTKMDVIGLLNQDSVHIEFAVLEKGDTSSLEFKWINKVKKRASWKTGYFYSDFTTEQNKRNYPCYEPITAAERKFRNMSTDWTLLTRMDSRDVIYQSCQSELKRMEIRNSEEQRQIIVYTGNDSHEFNVSGIKELNTEVVSDDLVLTTSVPRNSSQPNMPFKITWLNEKEIVCEFPSFYSYGEDTIRHKYVDSKYAGEYLIIEEEGCEY